MFWCIVTLATCFKALLINSYHSTDFEVHRHWLSLTYSLSWKSWYTDNTSEWTLDYPPFFAFFEWCLSQLAQFFDPNMVKLSKTGYISEATIIFQRLSVIISELTLYYGVHELSQYLTNNPIRKCSQSNARWKSPTTIYQISTIGNVGLILVDNIHFQYNGFMLGILLLSVSHILNGRHYWGAFWFSVLIYIKHIYIYMSPAFFIYLLRNHCITYEHDRPRWMWKRIFTLASIVIAVTAVAIGPFVLIGQTTQLLSRLFPFKRGLTHAYWAPNIWAIYNFIDRLMIFSARKFGFSIQSSVGSMTDGLVRDNHHVFLPTITPGITLVLTVFAILPCLVKLWKNPGNPLHFVRAIVLCTLSAFLFGWHVHEKAILMVIIPHSLLAVIWRKEAEVFAFLSTVGHYSLLPLLFTPKEVLLKFLIFILQTGFTLNNLGGLFHVKLFNKYESWYTYGLIAISMFDTFGSSICPLLGNYEFLPLMITSVYCSFGLTYIYLKYYGDFLFSFCTNKRVTF